MRWVVDSAWTGGRVARGVALTVDGDRIAAVEPAPPPGRGLHALPGFVDAHVHLELSAIRGEDLPHGAFADWIDALIDARSRPRGPSAADAVRAGVAELIATGTVAVGDVDLSGEAWPVLRETPLEGVVHRELLGAPPPARLDELERALAADARAAEPGRGLKLGVSPHAPYTTGEATYRLAFDWSRRLGVPVASHLEETGDEEEFLRHGRGPLAVLLRARAFPFPEWSDPHASPFERVRALAPPPGFVVIHGNHLSDAELAECAARRWPIVHCPRSHRYFGHGGRPVARALELGVTLALGTDSRASNGSLDLWAEMASLRAAEPAIGDDAILAAATSAGRRALGLEPAELEPGQPATFQLVRTRDGSALAPERLAAAAVRAELETSVVLVRGRLAHGDATARQAG